MKCKHSWVNYIPRAVIALFFLSIALDNESGADTQVFFFLMFGLIVGTIVVDRLTNYLTFDGHAVEGRSGLIRRKRLTSAVSRIDYCEYKRFLLWNSIKIGTGSSTFLFRNMRDGRSFVDAVNLSMSRR